MGITPYLYVPLITWAVAQTIKFVLALVRGDVDLRYLYASGGMPSVHSAVVCSLATYALIEGGPTSPLFGLTAVFAAIVMYDSFGVRRSSGEQAKTLNKLIGELGETGSVRDATQYDHLREILGHKPVEVGVGAVLGVAMGVLFGIQKLQPGLNALYTATSPMQAKLLAGLGVVVIVSALLIRAFYKARNKQVKTKLQMVFYCNLLMGILIALAGVAGYEQVAYFSTQLAAIAVVVVWVVLFTILFVQLLMASSAHKAQASSGKSREAWLKKAGKKK